MSRELTLKQKKFIEAFKGNAKEAAKIAGYSGDNNALAVMGAKLLINANIKAELLKRQNKEIRYNIATRLDRQRFWTEVMLNAENEMRDRLKAAELLGRSEADFTDRVEANITFTQLSDKIKEARERLRGITLIEHKEDESQAS